ncbi:MAG: heme biosynthesis protein HemY [Burkholderiales bacterium]
MKALFWIVGLFALAVGLTLLTRYNTGYMLIAFPPYRIELSLNLAIVLALAGFFVVYAILSIVSGTINLPSRVRDFRRQRRREKARGATLAGIRAFFEGRYAKAEKAASNAMKLGESPGLNAIVAARSAHEMGGYSKRDGYIAEAETRAPDDSDIRLMAQAELLLEDRRAEDALRVLAQLRNKHTAALRLELKAQQQAKNWDEVIALIAQLDKRKVFDGSQLEQLKRQAYSENLKQKAVDPATLDLCWQKIPTRDRKDNKTAAAAAQCFMLLGDNTTAHQIIEQSLESQWDSELVALYASCLGNDVVRQIDRAEKWLKSHESDAALLLTLGKLCAHQELWGKAQSYLEASLALAPSHSAHLALAQLQERLGQSEESRKHYQKSVDMVLNQLRNVTGGRRKSAL